MKTVVVGGGLAGVLAAKKLNATLITNNKYFTFLPRLPQAIHKDHPTTQIPITNCVQHVIIGQAEINLEKSKVYVNDTTISYDELIIATGATPAHPIPGIEKYTKQLYSYEDALELQNVTNQQVVLLGAGPTGVELAIELAKKQNQVTILQRGREILPHFSSRTRSYAHKQLTQANIQIKTNNCCTKVTSTHVHTAQEKHPYDIAVWTGGLTFTKPIQGQEHGLVVNEFLQLPDHPNVYAIGDCARSKSPLTAQAAQQEAVHAVKNIRRARKNKSLKAFHYHSKGDFLLLGDVAVIDSKFSLHGKLAKFIRKTYYDLQLLRYKL